MVQWVVGSIPHGRSDELFLVPDSAPRLVYQKPWYVLFCLRDRAYKSTLAANQKVTHVVAAADFLYHCLSGILPYIRLHLTVNEMCWSASLNKTFF